MRPSPVHELDGKAEGLQVVGMSVTPRCVDACRKLLADLPADCGMAVIVQLSGDVADLPLADAAKFAARPVADGVPIETNSLYVIPAGDCFSIDQHAFRRSPVPGPDGSGAENALACSLAEFGPCAAWILLPGVLPEDGSALQAIKDNGGITLLAVDQGGDNGRRSDLAPVSDVVLPVEALPGALVRIANRSRGIHGGKAGAMPSRLPAVLDLLRTTTAHDFGLYEQAALLRGVGRRMAIAACDEDAADDYLDQLRRDGKELRLLATELLANRSCFFADPQASAFLAEHVIPELVREQAPGTPIRLWISGCGTGEAAFTLAILFLEEIAASGRDVGLEVFASDTDVEALACARRGFYPDSIDADVSEERLDRFFVKRAGGYRIAPALRGAVTFATHDLLTEPPFSRIDLLSCRHLVGNLRTDVQQNVTSMFHVALREMGILLLRRSDAPVDLKGSFAQISDTASVYRHVRSAQPGELRMDIIRTDSGFHIADAGGHSPAAPTLRIGLADRCRRLAMDCHGPAAVAVDRNNRCVFSMGATDQYLHTSPDRPTTDVLEMTPASVRGKLRSAIREAAERNAHAVVHGTRMDRGGQIRPFSVDVHPIRHQDEDYLLICFVDQSGALPGPVPAAIEPEPAMREMIRDLEGLIDEKNAVIQEVQSVSAHHRSLSEELRVSEEQLQAANRELAALNAKLHDSIRQQKTVASDLQGLLNSMDGGALWLDLDLRIRFFSHPAGSLFSILPGDIGRPLSDLSALAADGTLVEDANAVIRTGAPVEQEVKSQTGAWYARRVTPYLGEDAEMTGVVISFVDITRQKLAVEALEASKRHGDLLNVAKTRFLSHANHELRQPLQTLALLHGLLLTLVKDEAAQKLLHQLDQTLHTVSDMLNALFHINQVDSGIVRAEPRPFCVNSVLDKLQEEFAPRAEAYGVNLRVVPCTLSVKSDPLLLELLLKNLLENAIKHTRHGKVLLGCRRDNDMLCVEIVDAGDGLSDADLRTIVEERGPLQEIKFDQPDQDFIGLSMAKRLAELLGHRIRVRARSGSIYSVDVMVPSIGAGAAKRGAREKAGTAPAQAVAKSRSLGATRSPDKIKDAVVYVVDDDKLVRSSLRTILEDYGLSVETYASAEAFLASYRAGGKSCLLLDAHLPGMSGVELLHRLDDPGRPPTIMITGRSDVLLAVQAMKAGAVDFVEKPIGRVDLIARLERALDQSRDIIRLPAGQEGASSRLSTLTPRQKQIMTLILDGHPSKLIAVKLGISQRTVESHRATIMNKTGSKSVAALARLVLATN